MNYTPSMTKTAVDARVRRAAYRAGYIARKSRARPHYMDNRGDYMLVDFYNHCAFGEHFELSPEDVFEICEPKNEGR